jgi:hypothetical protein
LLNVVERLALGGVGCRRVGTSLEVELKEGEHTREVVSLERHVRQVLSGRHTKVVVYAGSIELLKAFFVSKHLMSAGFELQGSPLLLSAGFSLIQISDIHIVQLEPSVCRIKHLERGKGKIETFFMGV